MQTYHFINRQKNTIEVSSHFATMIAETEEKYTFQIVFRVLQSDVIKKSLSKVAIKCVNPNIFIDKKSGLQVLSRAPSKKLKQSINQSGLFEIDNILLKHQKQKKVAEAKRNSIISQSTINLQAYVDSRVASLLKSGKEPVDIEALYSYKDTLELFKDDYYFDDSSGLEQNDIKNYNFELISAGIHPASIVSKFENYFFDDKIISLRNYYLNDSLKSIDRESSYYVATKQKKLNDKISIRVLLEIPKNLVQNSVEIHFEVSKLEKRKNCSLFLSDSPVERIVKSIDLLKHYKFFKLQNNPPTISVKGDEIETKQVDKNADTIKIEKKEISNSGECTKYSLVNQGFVAPNHSISVIEPQPDNKFCLFRCISSNSSTTIVNSLINCAVTGKTTTKINTLTMSISDRQGSLSGVEINVKYPPRFISQFQVSKRQWLGAAFGPKKIVSHYQYFEGQSTIVLDEEIKHTDICEYVLDYKTETGEIKNDYITRIYQYFKDIKNSVVSVEIQNPVLSVVNGKPEFNFSIIPTTPASDVDKAEALSGLAGVTSDNAKRLGSMSSLSDSYNHVVSRLNLKTGERNYFLENYGKDVLFGADPRNINLRDTFENRKYNNAAPLDLTADYLYEVRSYRKNTLATMRDYIDTVTLPPSSNQASPRIYYYRPFKWRQNYTTETGTLPALDEKNNLLTRTFMEDGEIGVTATYLLTGLNKILAVNSVIAERIDANKVRLSWKLQGSIDEFDHFIIVKEVNKIRRFVGATFNQEIFDVLENNDLGTIIYYVIPIFYDFSAGVSRRSNSMLVDPEELDFKQQISEI